jgi:hypothetical protein
MGFCLALIGSIASAHAAAAEDSTVARTTIVASADVGTRTSITQSTELLRFQVIDPDQPVEAVMTFAAGARASASSDILLIVTAQTPLEIASSPSFGEIAFTVSSGADNKPLTAGERIVAAQWIGGGVRSGQLRFRLRAAAGMYSVPVTLQLIVP